MKDKRRLSDFKANYEDTWDKEANPYYDTMHKLWISVILKAMCDAKTKPSGANGHNADSVTYVEHQEAVYLFEDGAFGRTRLRELCELAATPMRIILDRYNDPNFDPVEAIRGIANVKPLSDPNYSWDYREKNRIRSSIKNAKRKSNISLAN